MIEDDDRKTVRKEYRKTNPRYYERAKNIGFGETENGLGGGSDVFNSPRSNRGDGLFACPKTFFSSFHVLGIRSNNE